jgi:hypothetical protein
VLRLSRVRVASQKIAVAISTYCGLNDVSLEAQGDLANR